MNGEQKQVSYFQITHILHQQQQKNIEKFQHAANRNNMKKGAKLSTEARQDAKKSENCFGQDGGKRRQATSVGGSAKLD